jgi:hypothetical protein
MMNYYDYIKSDEWYKKARRAKRLAGNRCRFCNRSASEVKLNAHHRTYENLGHETMDDLTVFCEECHGILEQYSTHRPSKRSKPSTNIPSIEIKMPVEFKPEHVYIDTGATRLPLVISESAIKFLWDDILKKMRCRNIPGEALLKNVYAVSFMQDILTLYWPTGSLVNRFAGSKHQRSLENMWSIELDRPITTENTLYAL